MGARLCIPKKQQINPIITDLTYKSAGLLFYSDKHVIGGYQPNKKTPFISGFGGKRKEGETFFETAIRETVEELFDIKDVPIELINKLRYSLIINETIQSNGYVMLSLFFPELIKLFQTCKEFKIKSPLYQKMPSTIEELIFQRKINKSAEISHIVLLPFVKCNDAEFYADEEYINDINTIIKQKIKNKIKQVESYLLSNITSSPSSSIYSSRIVSVG